MVTTEQIKKLFGIDNEELITALNDTLDKYDINTPIRIQHFLAQVGHESGHLKVFRENLNYSSSGLLRVFPKYFSSTQATSYARQPQKIASRVYANRLGNGNEASQEGWKYKGRGVIQITGKYNYQLISDDLDIDFINEPELLETLPYSILSAGWYWDRTELNKWADKDDVLTITKKINGGTNGLQDRKEILAKAKTIIK
jgi:putative chitinase